MCLGEWLFYVQANTKDQSEVKRRKKLKKLRFNTWKSSIDLHVTSDKKRDFFTFLLYVYAEGTKRRRIIVAVADLIVTGRLIVKSLPGMEEVESNNIGIIVAWFLFLLVSNVIINKLISLVKDKVLKENYYIHSLINEYVLEVLVRNN